MVRYHVNTLPEKSRLSAIAHRLFVVHLYTTKQTEMKAILNVNQGSAYAMYSGHTFEVVSVRPFALKIEGRTVDFSKKEILIVDLANELQKAFDDYNFGSDTETYAIIRDYAAHKGIVVSLKYNCPA